MVRGIPVYPTETIEVKTTLKPLNYYVERETQPLTFGALATFSPPVDERWKIHALQVEFSADANAGTREIWQYITDLRRRQQRYQMFCATAGNTYTMIARPGTSISTNAAIPFTTLVYTGPLYLDDLVNENNISILWEGFQGAGDIGLASLLVSKFKRD